MQRKLWGTCITTALMGALFMAACSSSDGTEDDGAGGAGPGDDTKVESTLEFFSWWIAPGEKEALDALLEIFSEANPDTEVTNAAAIDAETQRDRLKQRLETGDPPDAFQGLSGVDMLGWVDKGKMTSLNDLDGYEDWKDNIPAAVLDTVTKEGKLYAVPLNIERDNNLYYSIPVLEENNIDPPRTLDDVFAACDTLKSAGMETPLAIPAAGWVLGLVFVENLFAAVTGGDFYMDYFTGQADPDDPKVQEAVEAFKTVLECSNVATSSDQWPSGGDALYSGDAAMYIMGDWGKAYLEGDKDSEGKERANPWKGNVDFGVVPGLGSDGYFVFNSAVFGLPKNAPHPNAAKAFIEVVGSEAGQSAFNPKKGSLPARSDVDLSDYDEITQGAGADFAEAAAGTNKLLPGYASMTTGDYQSLVNPSLLVFAVGGERAAELDASIPETEQSVEALDVDYLLAKLKVAYGEL